MELLSQFENDPTPGGKIHDSVVRTLGGWILGGVYQPGDILPREDEIAVQLGVSRTSVREAVKVISANGLVESRQRVGVRVRPHTDWRLLDPAVLSWHPNLRRDPTLVADLLEARRIIEPAAAELAARRASASDLAAIETAYLSMERAIPEDPRACCEADLAFHRNVIVASHNIVLTGLIGTIEAALRASFLLTSQLMQNQSKTLSVHKDVVEKIRLRDTAGARTAMNRLLDVAAEDLDLRE
jgi:DNA-binding FadR family transcriptional regulator